MTTLDSGLDLVAEERAFSSVHGDEWDDFAAASGESFLGAWGVIKARRFFGRVRLFDFLLADRLGSRRKVGQCAVQVRNQKVTFLDKIQLLPAHRQLNRRCLDLLAAEFGRVTYQYGSHWNVEDDFDLKDLPRFDVDRKIFHLDLIEFREWTNFAAYRRAVSENIRRDYKKAKEACAVSRTYYGLEGLRDLFAFVAMRRYMSRRNNLRFSGVRDYLTHVGRLLVLGKKAFVTTVMIKGTCYAAFFGAEVGNRLYYLSGGTRSNHLGAGSYLFLNLIENWFAKHPDGELLMGDCPKPLTVTRHDRGNLLYRRKLRVRSVNGVEFQLRPNQQPAIPPLAESTQKVEPEPAKRARSAHA